MMSASDVRGPCLRQETRHDGAWVRLVLDRPKANVVSKEMMIALRDAIAGLPASGPLKLVTLEGAGSHFSFGASVPEHLPDQIGQVLPLFHEVVRDLLNVPAVTAAVVRGQCLGGGFELVLACDLVFAADDAQMGVPEITLGVFPPIAAALLPARVGVARSTRAVVTGAAVPATDWHTAGLIEAVTPTDMLDETVEHWFQTHLVPKSAAALRFAVVAARGPIREAATALPELERLYLGPLMRTHDAAEGVRAFLEKRAPAWRDA